MICVNCKVFLESNNFFSLEYLATTLIVCENCWQKIVDRCHTCGWPIYKNDLIYEFSINRGAEYLVSASETEKKVQCYSCYHKWLREQKWKKWIRWGLLISLIFCVIGLLFLILPLFKPELIENWEKTPLLKRRILIALLFVLPIIICLVIQEFGGRYKIRERKV